MGSWDDCLVFDNKLMSYAFAQSHEVSIPHLFGWWRSIDDLDPAKLVAENTRKCSSQPMEPLPWVLQRQTASRIRATIESWHSLSRLSTDPDKARIAPPFFTEERLGASNDSPLVDIKVYAFYG
jgi:hypothetical protein